MSVREIPGVQKPVVKHARATGWLAWKMKIEGWNGCPDFWFFKNADMVIIEFKAEDCELSVQQERRAEDLREHGFEVHVIDSAADGIALLDRRGQIEL